jgi:hypothetical protein
MGCNKCGRNSPLEWYRTEGHIFLLCDECLVEKKRSDADEKEKERRSKQVKETDPVKGCLAFSGCGGCLGLLFFMLLPLFILCTHSRQTIKLFISTASPEQWEKLCVNVWSDPANAIIAKISTFLILIPLILISLPLILKNISMHLNKWK